MFKIETEKKVVTIEKTVKEVSLAEYIGHIFRTAREKKGMNSIELAAATKDRISHTHIRNIEKGLNTIRLRDIELLCEFLDVDVRTLFGGVVPIGPEETL